MKMKHWTQDELQLAILRVLLDKRKKRPKDGGESGKGLADRFGYDSDTSELVAALHALIAGGLIEPGQRNFLITANGVDFVEENGNGPSPPDDQPGPPEPPWSPGTDPDGPSRVPR